MDGQIQPTDQAKQPPLETPVTDDHLYPDRTYLAQMHLTRLGVTNEEIRTRPVAPGERHLFESTKHQIRTTLCDLQCGLRAI